MLVEKLIEFNQFQRISITKGVVISFRTDGILISCSISLIIIGRAR